MDENCLANNIHMLSRYLKQVGKDVKTVRSDTEELRVRTPDARSRARYIGAAHNMTMALISIQSAHKNLMSAINDLDNAPIQQDIEEVFPLDN